MDIPTSDNPLENKGLAKEETTAVRDPESAQPVTRKDASPDADAMLALALQKQEYSQMADDQDIMSLVYHQDVWEGEGNLVAVEKSKSKHAVVVRAHSAQDSSPSHKCQGSDNSTEYDHEVRLMQSPVGVAWKLVERFILLWHAKPRWNGILSLLSRDDMVAMAEKLVLLLHHWKSQSSQADRLIGRWNVDVGFHWTRLENLESIREGGLLTKMERDQSGISAHYHGSSFGDGVYTASSPFDFYGRYGEACLIVARLKGVSGFGRVDNQVHTVVDRTGRMAVLKTSKQCFPIFVFHKNDISINNAAFQGNQSIRQCHADVQRILDEFLNDGFQTPVPCFYECTSIHRVSRAPAFPRTATYSSLMRQPRRYNSSFATQARDDQNFIQDLYKTEHVYVAHDEISESNFAYSPTAKMVYCRNHSLTCQGFGPGSIVIKYRVEKGKQCLFHPNPGEAHAALERVAFLPATADGDALLRRLVNAFLKGCTFCVMPKTDNGTPNQVEFLIPHKTTLATGFDGFTTTVPAERPKNGYPDPHFFPAANRILDSFACANHCHF
jgi:hypothetical protein